MKITDIIPLLITPNNAMKEQVEELLRKAYMRMHDLRKMCLDKNLTIEYIKETEEFFIENQFNPADLDLPKYLEKYAKILSDFWESYNYYKYSRISRGKFNLFTSLKEEDFKLKKSYSDTECAKVLRKMEDYWVASNQVYPQYQISLIRKIYK